MDFTLEEIFSKEIHHSIITEVTDSKGLVGVLRNRTDFSMIHLDTSKSIQELNFMLGCIIQEQYNTISLLQNLELRSIKDFNTVHKDAVPPSILVLEDKRNLYKRLGLSPYDASSKEEYRLASNLRTVRLLGKITSLTLLLVTAWESEPIGYFKRVTEKELLEFFSK